MNGLLDHRLIFVTGKGGVGKSTVATALGLVAARGGRRTIVAELAGQDRVPGAFAREATPFVEVPLLDGLHAISIDPQLAMEEYLRVKTGALGQALGSSRLFNALAMATPGMRELLSVGKAWELSQPRRRSEGTAPYDLAIVDLPAAGHGAAILRTPRSFHEMARVGPIAHQAGTIAQTIADPAFTAVVAVTTAEEMPVNETLWLRDALAADGLTLSATIVNGLHERRFSDEEAERLHAARRRVRSAAKRAALDAALSQHARQGAQHEQLRGLRDGLGAQAPLVELPFLYAERLGPAELGLLADELERCLGPTGSRGLSTFSRYA
ncbi:MAG: ArsA family ATPase [Solirubrobacteraceae bacterium]